MSYNAIKHVYVYNYTQHTHLYTYTHVHIIYIHSNTYTDLVDPYRPRYGHLGHALAQRLAYIVHVPGLEDEVELVAYIDV